MSEFLTKFFKLEENHTNVKTELLAGLTTFMTIAYILAVNPSILSVSGMDAGAIFTATALGGAIGCLLMAFLSNYPVALMPGMGLNAFFAFTVCGQMGYSWKVALAAVFVEGIIFIILSLTKVRESIFNTIPTTLKFAVTAGIGLFITFIGLQSSRLVVDGPTLVTLFPFKATLASGTFASAGVGPLLALIGIIFTGFLMVKKVPGDMLFGILFTWALGIICELTGLYIPDPKIGAFSVLPDFTHLGTVASIAPTFMQMDFSMLGTFNFIVVVFAFIFVDLFDTLGTLIGVTAKANLLDEEGKLEHIEGALLADSVATTAGAVLGTSTVTSAVESGAGVSAGGRTGLTAVTVAVLYILSLFFSPIFLAIPAFATAPALVMVGFSMMGAILNINFNDFAEAIPAFITIITMPFTYSIAEGIALGTISYVVINVLAGKSQAKKFGPLIYLLALLFIFKYVFV